MKQLLWMLPTFLALVAICAMCDAEEEELPDFDFDKTGLVEDAPNDAESGVLQNKVERHESPFLQRDKKIRKLLIRALTNGNLRRKFSEVLPVLRMMSKSQRLTLVALIQAQVDRNGNHSLTLSQVKQLFGNREELILPLVLDIANLIKVAGDQKVSEPQRYREDEVPPSIQSLQRSFLSAKPHGFKLVRPASAKTSEENESESIARVTDITKLVAMNLKEDTLEVDEGESIVRNVSAPVSRTKRLFQYPPNEKKLAQSYHERKFNMTAFNSTDNQIDQDAVASETVVSIALPDNLSLDEIEDQTFGSFGTSENDTLADPRGNSTEDLPMPELLIARKRFRPFPRPQLSNRKEIEDCEAFSGTICLHVKNYPKEQIMRSIRRHRTAMNALLVDYNDKAERLSLNDEFSEQIRRKQDGVENPGQMCESIVRYARPQKARSATGEWKYVVNTGGHTQTLRLEKCSSPEDSCSYLTDNYRSRCVQVYNYHRLLSWDATRGLHVDIFKVPTCCSCHIDGYREAFPPLSEYENYSGLEVDDAQLQSSSNHHHYSTVRDQDEEDDDDDYYKYETSSTRSKKRPSILSSGSSHKNRYKHKKPFSPSPALEPYLSPPSSSYDPVYSYRRPSRRRPSQQAKRKQSMDQVPSGSDFVANEVTVLPPRARNNSMLAVKLPNVTDAKRVNYNYHPIIDFFEKDKPQAVQSVERIGNLNPRNNWRPLANRRGR